MFGVCDTSQNAAAGINVCPEIERRGGWDVAQVGGGGRGGGGMGGSVFSEIISRMHAIAPSIMGEYLHDKMFLSDYEITLFDNCQKIFFPSSKTKTAFLRSS